MSTTIGSESGGVAAQCGKTFTFLPLISLPYTHFSLLARCHALWRRFMEDNSWEKSGPKLKDADRLPDASTVRRWSKDLDGTQPAASFVNQTVWCLAHWLDRGRPADRHSELPSWMGSTLQGLLPLRL